MRVKKFTCIYCGAPKVNEYKSPYIVCDFCGSLTDIDFNLGFEKWQESSERTLKYQFYKAQKAFEMQNALAHKDRNSYYNLQRDFWNTYYQTYPEYLPPSIDNAHKYSVYLEVCAVSSTESGFEPKWQQYVLKQQQLQQMLSYYQTGGETKVESAGFFNLAVFFIEMTREGMKTFYENPRYQIMHELLPWRIHLKMKLSMFVQAWLPYLVAQDSVKLLNMCGFSLDYVEIKQPPGKNVECGNCRTGVFVPEGSYKVFCENCHKVIPVVTAFNCSSCGALNQVPENPGKPFSCGFCRVENRLIKPLFG